MGDGAFCSIWQQFPQRQRVHTGYFNKVYAKTVKYTIMHTCSTEPCTLVHISGTVSLFLITAVMYFDISRVFRTVQLLTLGTHALEGFMPTWFVSLYVHSAQSRILRYGTWNKGH